MNPAQAGLLGSLRRRLLLPTFALGMLVATLVAWAIHEVGAHQLSAKLSTRASLAVHAISYAAESCARVGELQRFVSALGADKGITLVVVVAGEPARVIAATRQAWIGLPVTELPTEHVREDLVEVLTTRRARDGHHLASDEYDSSLPLRFDQLELSGGSLGEGAVMVHLDAQPARRQVQATTAWFAAGFLAILAAAGFLGYRLLARCVLSPLDELGRSFAEGEHVAASDWLPAMRRDEIGVLARTLRDAVGEADAARRALENLEFAFDQHSIVAVTDAAGVLTHVNDRFCEVSKYSRAELLGKTHAVINSGHHDARFFTTLWSTITAGTIWNGEICNRAKDGSIYWVDSTIVPLLDETGKTTQFVAIRTDITWRKQAERDLVAAKEAAESAAQAKADFLAMMSHEIRTPMNGVVGFADLLLETELTAEQQRLVSTIQGSGDSLLCIINDILDFSKIEAGRFEIEAVPMDLAATVDEVVTLLTPRLTEKGITARIDYRPDTPRHLLGDPTRVRQVLLNLLGNAVKFTEVGRVTVTVEAPAVGEPLRIAVTDTGIGIPEGRQDALFARFTQADASTTRQFGGTGLGLAISKSLVELMGGEIGFDSEPGRGSTFWFTLPVDEVAASEVEAPAGQTTGTPAPSATIGLEVLVGEDNIVSQELIGRLLTRFGCSPSVVADGALAVELFRQRSFDLVLMDCQMPQMDGLEATREIRRLEAESPGDRHRTPILALTAGVTDQERESCAEAGMDGFLSKPIRPKVLEQALLEIARRRPQTSAAGIGKR